MNKKKAFIKTIEDMLIFVLWLLYIDLKCNLN